MRSQSVSQSVIITEGIVHVVCSLISVSFGKNKNQSSIYLVLTITRRTEEDDLKPSHRPS